MLAHQGAFVFSFPVIVLGNKFDQSKMDRTDGEERPKWRCLVCHGFVLYCIFVIFVHNYIIDSVCKDLLTKTVLIGVVLAVIASIANQTESDLPSIFAPEGRWSQS